MERLIKVWNVGKLSYSKGLKLQKLLSDKNKTNSNINNVLLCVEHSPVYTIGIRTQQYTDDDINQLKEKGAEFFRTNRGGLITFHGPGQLVVYPIINLKHFKPNIRWYVSQIENTVIDVCRSFNLKAETSSHTGVWINDKKVCAIGIHASRFVTTHGLALNCSTDLTWFDHIVPCGIEGKGVTSLSAELKRNVTIPEVMPLFLNKFKKSFQCEIVTFPECDRKRLLECLN